MKKIIIAVLLAMSIQAFSQNSGSHWKVLYVWEGFKMENIASKKGEILISLGENKMSGKIGCTKFNGNLEYAKGNNIKPIKLTSTKENCQKEPDLLDNAVLKALKMANKLVIDQNKAKFYQGEKLVLELNR